MKALTVAEIDAVLAASDERLRAMVLLGFRHGMRPIEVVSLLRADVHLEARTILVRRRKGSLTTLQPLCEAEITALRQWLAVAPESPYVFPGRGKGHLHRSHLWRLFSRLAGKGAHSLKHSLGYALVQANVNLAIVKQALGHKSITSTAVYTVPTDEMVGVAVAHALQGSNSDAN